MFLRGDRRSASLLGSPRHEFSRVVLLSGTILGFFGAEGWPQDKLGETLDRETDTIRTAKELNRRALRLYREGDLGGAREALEEALRVQLRLAKPDPSTLATTRSSLGGVLAQQGAYVRAVNELRQAVELRQTITPVDLHGIAAASSNLGGLLSKMGEYTDARPHLERALDAWTKTARPEAAIVLNSLGLLHQYLGDFASASAFFEKALRVARDEFGPTHRMTAVALKNLGTLLSEAGDLTAAHERLKESLSIEEKVHGPDHRSVGTTLNHLGWVLQRQGEHTTARGHYERALEIRRSALGDGHPDVAWTLYNLGRMAHDRGDLERAKRLYQRAHDIRVDSLGAEHRLTSHSLKGLALLEAQAGEATAALTLALRAESIDREHVRDEARLLSEHTALRYAATRGSSWLSLSGLDLALTLCPALQRGQREAVWDALIRSRAMTLDELVMRQRVGVGNAEFLALRRARERFSNLMVRGPSGMDSTDYRGLLAAAREEKQRTEREFARHSLQFRAEASRRAIGYREVSAALQPGDALLGFALHQSMSKGSESSVYTALVVSAGGAPYAIALGSATDVEARIHRWKRQTTRQNLEAYRQAGVALRALIWDPIRAHLGACRRLFVVPDGALHLVSLSAMPLEEDRYLVENGPTIHYLTSERDLAAEPATAGEGLLALGGPAFDSRSESRDISAATFRGARANCDDFAAIRFERLPATLAEVQQIRSLWGRSPTTVLTGEAATEAKFKKLSPGRRVIHLATHGFFLGDQCPPAVASARGIGGFASSRTERSEKRAGSQPKTKEARPSVAEHPLRLSGLALAGANRRADTEPEAEDGILTAEEISALDLTGVEWAVLSACDTGAGDIQAGEGVLGLRRAFQVAGARTVIMSLWPVEDRSTRRWMELLYRARFEQGRATAEAVREASLELLRERRASGQSSHPFFWAAFVAAGDWR